MWNGDSITGTGHLIPMWVCENNRANTCFQVRHKSSFLRSSGTPELLSTLSPHQNGAGLNVLDLKEDSIPPICFLITQNLAFIFLSVLGITRCGDGPFP